MASFVPKNLLPFALLFRKNVFTNLLVPVLVLCLPGPFDWNAWLKFRRCRKAEAVTDNLRLPVPRPNVDMLDNQMVISNTATP